MSMQKPERLFDSRVVERYIEEGLVTREEYTAYLASLPDVAEDGETSGIQMIVHPRARRVGGGGDEEDEG